MDRSGSFDLLPKPPAASARLVVLLQDEPSFSKSYYCREVSAGIRAAVRSAGCRSEFATGIEVVETSALPELTSDCAVVVVAPLLAENSLEPLRNLRSPTVLVSARDPDLSWVDTDNVLGAREVTEHLIRLGHSKILFVSGHAASQNSRDRLEGYRHALRAQGLPDASGLIVNANFGIRDAQNRIRERLIKSHVFSAVFAASDLMAVGAIRALGERGFAVPGDVAVAGYDDADFAPSFFVPLTTYRQPLRNLGFVAAGSAIEALRIGRRPSCQVELMGELVIRESCGAGPRRIETVEPPPPSTSGSAQPPKPLS